MNESRAPQMNESVDAEMNHGVHNPPTAVTRTALVLGGSSDIALAIVSALSEAGLCKVLLASRSTAGLEERFASAVPGVEVSLEQWDALNVTSHESLTERAADCLGRIDVVICAVGILGHHAGLEMDPTTVDEMVRTNFAGPAAALSAVAHKLVDQRAGSPMAGPSSTIVVLSSVAAARPRRSNFVYGSSKAGLDAFARGMGDALVGTGVRVLVVRPGFVRSRMTVGLDPAPMATNPETVGDAVLAALGRRGAGQVVWVPARLGPLFAVLGNLPAKLWRRVAADR